MERRSVSSAVDSLKPTQEGRGWRFYALIGAGLLLAILVLQNLQKVKLDFLFIHTTTPLIFALLIAGALGALIGWAFPHLRRSRKAERGAHLELDKD
ncbi:hypothetical protein BH10ACT11_BH10ACT11_17830 [soil metagenome]